MPEVGAPIISAIQTTAMLFATQSKAKQITPQASIRTSIVFTENSRRTTG